MTAPGSGPEKPPKADGVKAQTAYVSPSDPAEVQLLPKIRKQKQNFWLCPIQLMDFLVRVLMCNMGCCFPSVFYDSFSSFFPLHFLKKKNNKTKHIFSILFL